MPTCTTSTQYRAISPSQSMLHILSEMPTSPLSGEAEWADGDSGEELRLKKSVGESWFCLDVVSSEGSGLDEVT